MKRLKDTKLKYRIKIDVVQKHLNDKGSHSNIPYLITLEIEHFDRKMSIAFPYNQKGRNQLIKKIRKECYL